MLGGRTGGGGREWEEVVVFLASPPADDLSTKRIFYFCSVLSTNGCVSSQ